MRIIARASLVDYWTDHPKTKPSLEHWFRVTDKAEWGSTSEVQATFPKAKVLNGERIRFEVAGGEHRLIAAYRFDLQITWVKFLGTHAEYDRIDPFTVSMF